MLLAFVDESDHGDFHCFGAVLADEAATKSLTDTLNALMAKASVDYGISATTEFHAHPMFHGKEAWAGVGQRARPIRQTEVRHPGWLVERLGRE